MRIRPFGVQKSSANLMFRHGVSPPLSPSVYLRVRWVSPTPGRGASFPHAVSRAVHGLVRGGPAGGFYHRLSLGQGQTHWSKAPICYITHTRIRARDNRHVWPLCCRTRWFSTSRAAPPSTSTSSRCTAPSGSRAKGPFSCGATCSTCAVCPTCAAQCSCARTSSFPSTTSRASRCWAAAPSPWPTWPSRRCGTQSAATRTCGATARRSASLSIPWLCRWRRPTDMSTYEQAQDVGPCVFRRLSCISVVLCGECVGFFSTWVTADCFIGTFFFLPF